MKKALYREAGSLTTHFTPAPPVKVLLFNASKYGRKCSDDS